jgi:SAM-dependent methyltransferase
MSDFINEVFEWDVVNWSKALDLWGKKVGHKVEGKKALELGGRRGGPSLWLASQGYDVICSDLENPQQHAEVLHKRHSYQGNIAYQAINALEIPFQNTFDVVVFKSVLGGVGRDDRYDLQVQAMQQIHKALKKGGVLLFAENLTGSPVHEVARRKFIKWGASWRYLKKSEMVNLLDPFSEKVMKTTGFAGTFGRSEWQRNTLGKLDQMVLSHVVPSNWHYIVYGWAVK